VPRIMYSLGLQEDNTLLTDSLNSKGYCVSELIVGTPYYASHSKEVSDTRNWRDYSTWLGNRLRQNSPTTSSKVAQAFITRLNQDTDDGNSKTNTAINDNLSNMNKVKSTSKPNLVLANKDVSKRRSIINVDQLVSKEGCLSKTFNVVAIPFNQSFTDYDQFKIMDKTDMFVTTTGTIAFAGLFLPQRRSMITIAGHDHVEDVYWDNLDHIFLHRYQADKSEIENPSKFKHRHERLIINEQKLCDYIVNAWNNDKKFSNQKTVT